MFKHAHIDEAQNFHTDHWRFIQAAVAKALITSSLPKILTSGCMGPRIILRNYGIETRGGATKRLYANYRTTAHNLSYATSILEGTHWIDSESEEDNVVGYRSLANGPAPVVIHAADQHEEMKANCNNGQAMAGQRLPPPMHIGILTHTNRQTSELQAFLGEREISVSSDRFGAATLLTTGCSVV